MIFRNRMRKSNSSLLLDIILSGKSYFICILLDADQANVFVNHIIIKGFIILRRDAIIIIFLILIFVFGY
jgi:hypothetical protein